MNHLKSALRTVEKFLESHSILDYQIIIDSKIDRTEVDFYPMISGTNDSVQYIFRESSV